jgi:hypothetical protein
MRHLCKKTWPYKIKVENVNEKEHYDFICKHPEVKLTILARNKQWSDYNQTPYWDIYFKKESDLIFYKLCV